MAVRDPSFAPPAHELAKLGLEPPLVAVAPTPGQGLALDSKGVVHPSANQRVLAYDQIVADVTISATTEGTANSVISGTAVEYDGRPVLIQFFAPSWTTAVNNTALHIVLLDNGTVVGEIADDFSGGANANRQLDGFYRVSPTPGAHKYQISAWGTNLSTTKIKANSGGSATFLPAFLRITRDD